MLLAIARMILTPITMKEIQGGYDQNERRNESNNNQGQKACGQNENDHENGLNQGCYFKGLSDQSRGDS